MTKKKHETEEERETRLKYRRDYNANKRANETKEQRETRLKYHRDHEANKLANETKEQRDARLKLRRDAEKKRQKTKRQQYAFVNSGGTYSQLNVNYGDITQTLPDGREVHKRTITRTLPNGDVVTRTLLPNEPNPPHEALPRSRSSSQQQERDLMRKH